MAKIKKLFDDPFRALHLRLLLSYLGVMSTVLGVMLLFIYQYFASNLYNKFDRQLATLADAASHSLPKLSTISNSNDSLQEINQRDRIFDNDGDLDIPWQDLRSNQQIIEWFDITGKLLTRSGNPKIPSLAFNPNEKSLETAKVQQLEEYNDLRSLVVPIYLGDTVYDTVFFEAPKRREHDDDDKHEKSKNNKDEDRFNSQENSFLIKLFINTTNGLKMGNRINYVNQSASNDRILIGYVRVSEPSEDIEEELEGLVWGLGWGGLLAIALSGLSGWWLASQAQL